MKSNCLDINLDDRPNRMAAEKPKRNYKTKPVLTTNDFFAQYKDPRWQKKRLKIMERDNFMCYSCQDNGNTLNVHHAVPYRKNTKPWEYEDDELITLCENCHGNLSAIIEDCKNTVMEQCRTIESASEFGRIICLISGMDPHQSRKVWEMIDILRKYNG